jgi:hypothetical protein
MITAWLEVDQKRASTGTTVSRSASAGAGLTIGSGSQGVNRASHAVEKTRAMLPLARERVG